MITFPCPCRITASNYDVSATCYGIGIGANGRPFALVMYENGRVHVLMLDRADSIHLERGAAS